MVNRKCHLKSLIKFIVSFLDNILNEYFFAWTVGHPPKPNIAKSAP